LNRVVDGQCSIGVKVEFLHPFAMGFFRRLFSRKSPISSIEEEDVEPESLLSTLKEQYEQNIEQHVSSLEATLDSEDDLPEPLDVEPAPDYDDHDALPDDVLVEEEMKNYSDKNVVEHISIEELGNHLESAGIIGDVSTEVSFESLE